MSGPTRAAAERRTVRILSVVERGVFVVIGALLFVAALALLYRGIGDLWGILVSPAAEAIPAGLRFLDVVLLVLIFVELAYTVLLSLRGAVLIAEPFLIVGLIAVIRRILVITVGEARPDTGAVAGAGVVELAVLTGVVIAFVASIVALRLRARDSFEHALMRELQEPGEPI